MSRARTLARRLAATTYKNRQFRHLLQSLQTRLWQEAVEILSLIKQASDPLQVVQFIKDGELLRDLYR
jgi:hypothetical protein